MIFWQSAISAARIEVAIEQLVVLVPVARIAALRGK